jgi:pSer/pThr/pTyr-binding forkhead associated (FHA) protein
VPDRALVTLERTRPPGMVPAVVRPARFPCLIGRGDDCDVHLFDPALSRHHCRLDWRDDRLVVEDLGSRNGTLVNGQKVAERRVLADGDSLWVGASVFTVRLHAGLNVGVPRRVLVVEDDADAAIALAILLRGWGHDVQVARNGDRALAAARARPPDTVLLDLNLGDGPDGLEVAYRLRGEASLRNTRMFAVTGHPPEVEGVAGELDGVLVKPVDERALREVLNTVS